jgi:hypothetical protein
MLCPQCQASGQRSIVRVERTGTPDQKQQTDVFWDEAGDHHSHNPNIVVTEYKCSNGHHFAERSSWECPCGWKACEAELVTTT